MNFHRRAFDGDASERWQRELTSHVPEYVAEFIGTAFLMFCVVGAVALMFAPRSVAVSAIPSIGVRLFLTGLVLGGAGSLVAITPLGRISGAHLNPAISLGFFAVQRMHMHDLVGYVVAQIAGASLGAWAGQAAFGHLAGAVHDALNQPGDHVSGLSALGGEIIATFALTAVVLVMVSRRFLMRWTPLAVVGVVAVIVCVRSSRQRPPVLEPAAAGRCGSCSSWIAGSRPIQRTSWPH